jgi:signal peptidase I
MIRWLEHLLAFTGLLFLLYHLGFEYGVMVSGSMAPTLSGTAVENGDRILVERISLRVRGPKRWEVLWFHNEDGAAVAKRVVGLPGERITIKDNRIYINGTELPRPAHLQNLIYYGYGKLHHGREIECGSGYFVLGDDSRDSYDSRYIGPVDPSRFEGRAWCILWPPARAGFVR